MVLTYKSLLHESVKKKCKKQLKTMKKKTRANYKNTFITALLIQKKQVPNSLFWPY